MILKQSELSLLRRGRRWFILPAHPGWKPGSVVPLWAEKPEVFYTCTSCGEKFRPRFRNTKRGEPFVATVTEIVEEGGGFKVKFVPGDARNIEFYIAEGWPDYTTDPFRAMRDESPPVPETAEERKSRIVWLRLGGASPRERAPVYVQEVCNACASSQRARVVYSAGSDDAVRVIRRWLR